MEYLRAILSEIKDLATIVKKQSKEIDFLKKQIKESSKE